MGVREYSKWLRLSIKEHSHNITIHKVNQNPRPPGPDSTTSSAMLSVALDPGSIDILYECLYNLSLLY